MGATWWQLLTLRAALVALLLVAAQASSAAPFRLLLLARSLERGGLSEDEKRGLLHHEQREGATMPFGGVGRQALPSLAATTWLPLEVRVHAVRVESPDAGAGAGDAGLDAMAPDAAIPATDSIAAFAARLWIQPAASPQPGRSAVRGEVISGACCARFFAAGL